jgi:hypothetical protein
MEQTIKELKEWLRRGGVEIHIVSNNSDIQDNNKGAVV